MSTSDSVHPASLREASAENALRIGVVGGLAASSMLFASLTSAYLVRRSFTDWRSSPDHWLLLILVAAVCASIGVEIAAHSPRGRKKRGLALASLATLLYLGMVATRLFFLLGNDSALSAPHQAFLVLLLGLHAVHALLGGVFSVWVLNRQELVASASLSLVRLVIHFLTAVLAVVVLLLLFIQ